MVNGFLYLAVFLSIQNEVLLAKSYQIGKENEYIEHCMQSQANCMWYLSTLWKFAKRAQITFGMLHKVICNPLEMSGGLFIKFYIISRNTFKKIQIFCTLNNVL